MNKPLYFGYCRVSTDAQARSGASLEAQRAAIQTEADRNGWDVEWVIDAAYSGKDFGRPGLQAALSRLADSEGSGLVFHKVDRLARDLHDQTLVQRHSQAHKWDLVILNGPSDPSSPEGEFQLSVQGAASQYERRLIGVRTRDALAVRKAQGVRLGRPSRLPQEVRERIHQERATIGVNGRPVTFRQIAQGLNRDGVPRVNTKTEWTAQAVAKVVESVRLDLEAKAARN